MEIDELRRVVEEERLDSPVIYGEGGLHDDAVVLDREDDQWLVYLVNERASMIGSTLKKFGSESDALEHVLKKLRQVARARRSLAAITDEGSAPSPF